MAFQDSRELSGETRRYFRRNLGVNLVVDAGLGFAIALTAAATVVAVFLRYLGASHAVVGAAPGLNMACVALLQLPGVQLTRRLRAKKTFFVAMLSAAYLPVLVIGLLIPRWAETRPTLMIAVFLALYAVAWTVWGLASPLWGQLLPRLFPDRYRGLAMGLILAAHGGAGIAGGVYAAWTLAFRPFPDSFAHLFVTAALVMMLTRSVHHLAHEALPRVERPPRRKTLGRVLDFAWRHDRRLRRLLLARYIFEAGTMISFFYAVRGLDRFGLSDAYAGYFTLAVSLGMAGLAPIMGRLGDRRGYRRVMGWAMIIAAAANLLQILAPAPQWLFAVFLLMGAAQGADAVSHTNLLVEMSDEVRRGYYVALGFTALIPVRLLAPILWGLLGDHMGLAVLFPFALMLQLAGWAALIALVDDPRRPGRRIVHWQRGLLYLPRFY